MPILNVEANTPEWYALRKQYVGASEVSALFGLSTYKSLYTLWNEKAGRVSENYADNVNTLFGRYAESAIARAVEFEKKWITKKFQGCVAHPNVKGMFCTPDYEILDHERGLGILELKNVGHSAYSTKWVNDEPTPDYQLQIMHQLACCEHLGYKWGAIAAWVSGQTLRVIEYEIDRDVIAILEHAVADFWRSIENGIVPPVDSSNNTASTVKELYPWRKGTIIDLRHDNQLPELAAEFKQLQPKKKELEKRHDELKTIFRAKAEGNNMIKLADGFININGNGSINIRELNA